MAPVELDASNAAVWPTVSAFVAFAPVLLAALPATARQVRTACKLEAGDALVEDDGEDAPPPDDEQPAKTVTRTSRPASAGRCHHTMPRPGRRTPIRIEG